MRPAIPFSLVLTAAIAAAPAIAPAQDAAADGNTSIASVNGEDYSLDLFRIFYTQRMQESGAQNTPAFQEQAFNEFLSMVVAAQEGEKRELADSADVKTALELQRMMILSNAALQSMGNDNPPTEDELREAYEKFKEQAKRTEYKARHILVDDQTKAEDLIKKLEASDGENFDKLARENSLGPTAEKGGDLGWFDARQMVKPFSEAVGTLEAGSFTDQPVQTQFGWHVILLEDTRTAEPPSFEEARPNLVAAVKRQKVADELNALRESAKVDLNQDVVKLKEPTEEAPEAKD